VTDQSTAVPDDGWKHFYGLGNRQGVCVSFAEHHHEKQ